MKLLRVTVRFEYAGPVESIFVEAGVEDFVWWPRLRGSDQQGRHYGNQVFPGHLSLIEALVSEQLLDTILERLEQFRCQRPSHQHLRAAVLPVERSCPPGEKSDT
jgi:hypothetical protein